MKRILFALTLLLACSTVAGAIEFTAGGIKYRIISESSRTVEVTSFSFPTGTISLTLDKAVCIDNIKYKGEYTVVSIGDGAFKGCTGLKNLTIGNSVTNIGSSAFSGCAGLTSVVIGNSVSKIGNYAFSSCNSLKSVIWNAKSCYEGSFSGLSSITSFTFGDEVEIIPAYLCQYLSQLENVTIPELVTSIGDRAFYGCSSLTSINFTGLVTNFGEHAFSNTSWYNKQPNGLIYAGLVAYKYKGNMPSGTSIILTDDTKCVADACFSGCVGLTSVTIPNSVISIGEEAFKGCKGLKSVTIPKSVTKVGNNAFNDCTGITSVTWNAKSCDPFFDYDETPFHGLSNITSFTFGDEVEQIPGFLCCDLELLTSVTIPNSVSKMDNSAFIGCTGLTRVMWNAQCCADFLSYGPFYGLSNITSITIGKEVVHFPRYLCSGMNGLKNVTWNANMTIWDQAFKNDAPFKDLANITSFTIGDEVEMIPFYLCYGLVGLTSVSFGKSVTIIGERAFYDCTRLTDITLPNSVAEIGDEAFKGCTDLNSITIPNSVTIIGTDAFSSTAWYNNQPDGLVYVGLVAYKYKGAMLENTEIKIKEGTIGVANNAFSNCSGMTSITIPSSVTVIVNSIFKGCSGLKIVTWNAKKCNVSYSYAGSYQNYEVPFKGLTNIANFVFGDEVEWIPSRLCYGLNGLTSVTIPNNVTSIGGEAFGYCSGLTNVTIGNSVTAIETRAFRNCTAIQKINSYPNPDNVKLGNEVFLGVPKNSTLHVLKKYEMTYEKADQWKDFKYIRSDLTEIDGIEEVCVDELDDDLPMDVYNLNGVKVGDSLDDLPAGIYVIRQGNKSAKVVK